MLVSLFTVSLIQKFCFSPQIGPFRRVTCSAWLGELRDPCLGHSPSSEGSSLFIQPVPLRHLLGGICDLSSYAYSKSILFCKLCKCVSRDLQAIVWQQLIWNAVSHKHGFQVDCYIRWRCCMKLSSCASGQNAELWLEAPPGSSCSATLPGVCGPCQYGTWARWGSLRRFRLPIDA